MPPPLQYGQADPPGCETCAVYLLVFVFMLGVAVWIVLRVQGVI